MRTLFLYLLLLPMLSIAEAGEPKLSLLLVRNARGAPLQGAQVDAHELRRIKSTKRHPAWTVEMHFTVGEDFPYKFRKPGDKERWFLMGNAVPGDRKGRLQFDVLDCWCTEQYLLITHGTTVMRIDMPEGEERAALKKRLMARSGVVPTPEVVLFREGRYTFAEVMDGFEELEERLAKGVLRKAEKAEAIRLHAESQRSRSR